jgi:hypothetical protein
MTKELWMKEETDFTMKDGSVIKGYRTLYVRDMEEGENLDDIDYEKESEMVLLSPSFPMNVNGNFEELNDDEIDDMDIDEFNFSFYIGDKNGVPI